MKPDPFYLIFFLFYIEFFQYVSAFACTNDMIYAVSQMTELSQ